MVVFHYSKKILAVFAAATILGALLHFVYTLFPSPVTALFSPVCESLWEHLKLLYWPYLAAMLLLTWGGGKEGKAPWLLSALIICAAMLALGWLYYIALGQEGHWFGPVLYVALMVLGFLLPAPLSRTKVSRFGDCLMLLIVALGAAIALFSFLPPGALLFADLSGVRTWVTLPC